MAILTPEPQHVVVCGCWKRDRMDQLPKKHLLWGWAWGVERGAVLQTDLLPVPQTSELQRVLTEQRPGERKSHFLACGQSLMERPAQPPADPAPAPGGGRPQDSPGPQQPPASTPPEGQAGRPSVGFEERWHRRFRGFTASGDPIQDLRRISELCRLWLRPDLHTKEEMLDQLVLEQFTLSMPEDLQALVVENGLRRCQDLEDLLRSPREPQKWVSAAPAGRGQDSRAWPGQQAADLLGSHLEERVPQGCAARSGTFVGVTVGREELLPAPSGWRSAAADPGQGQDVPRAGWPSPKPQLLQAEGSLQP